jgi:glycosyltransferase involved in cell wall biosynthesis
MHALPSSESLDIVAIPDTPWDRIVWTNRQHIMLRLPRFDQRARVLYVAPPRFFARPFRDDRLAGRRNPSLWTTPVSERVWVVQPLIPLPRRLARRLARHRVDMLMIAIASRAARRLGFSSPCVWSYTPLYAAHIGAFDESFLVYDVVDDYSAMPYYRRTEGPRIAELDSTLTRRADLVFVVNDYLLEQRRPWNANCRFVGNAGDVIGFAEARNSPVAPRDMAGIRRPRIGFHGTLTGDKLDVPLVEELARRRPEWSFVLVGPEKDRALRDALRTHGNVHRLGPRSASDLPAYLSAFDVVLIPYRRTPFTGRPLKVYEALAAGVPVVATGIPELAGEPGVSVVEPSADAVEAEIACILTVERVPVPLESLESYSWESKARLQWQLLEECMAEARFGGGRP